MLHNTCTYMEQNNEDLAGSKKSIYIGSWIIVSVHIKLRTLTIIQELKCWSNTLYT